eukprot:jgi/Botrbrau1/18723/Bobra.0386s0046.1
MTCTGVISVSSSDDKDHPTIFTAYDGRNKSCIDLFAPGGSLGSVIVGAHPAANNSYIGVAVHEAGAFVAAGVAAQYLSLHPDATPAQVKDALIAMSTKDVLLGLQGLAPNRLLYTDLPARQVLASGTGGGSSLSGGAIAGIVIGAVAFAILSAGLVIGALIMAKRRRQERQAQQQQKLLEADMEKELAKAGLPPLKEIWGDLNDWELDPRDIRISKKPDGSEIVLGQGSFGRVVLGKRGVQDVAIKVTLKQNDERLMQNFVREIAIMRYLSRDRNIVQFYGAVVRPPHELWLVLEYMAGGDLREALNRDREGNLRWYQQGKRILLDVACGLAFCHGQRNGPIVHSLNTFRDLKSKNILLSKEGVAKISDMGLCREVVTTTLQTRTEQPVYGTFAWAEVCTQEMPIRGSLRPVQVPEECPPEVAELIEECLDRFPENRPSAQEVFRRLQAAPPEEEEEDPKLQTVDFSSGPLTSGRLTSADSGKIVSVGIGTGTGSSSISEADGPRRDSEKPSDSFPAVL